MYYKRYIKDKSSLSKGAKKRPEFIDKAFEFVQPLLATLTTKID